MTRPRNDLEQLKTALEADAEALLLALFGDPTKRGVREWRWGRKGSVAYRFDRRTFRSYEAMDKPGSLLDAIMFRDGCSFPAAITWAKQWLGDDDKPRLAPRPRPKFDADADEQARRAEAQALWRAGRGIAGTAAEKYLRGPRGIDREPDDCARFISARDVARITGWHWWRWPAIMYPLTDTAGNVSAVTLVALTDQGDAIADADGKKLKRTRGPMAGAALRLPGDPALRATGNLPGWPVDLLLAAEGAEDALSLWQATGCTTRAAMGAIGNMPLDDVPLSWTIVVARHDDPPRSPARKTLRDRLADWRRQGRRVVVAQPWQLSRGDKSDFNDTLKAGGPAAVRERIEAALTPMAGPPSKPRIQAVSELAGIIHRTVAELLNCRANAAPFKVGRATFGLGKSEETLWAILDGLRPADRLDRPIVYAAPMHTLTTELAERAAEMAAARNLNVRVREWRGREADDPDAPGEKMCRDLEAIELGRAARINVAETICTNCSHRFDCSYMAMKQATADLWLVPHALLFTDLPATIKDAALLVIDETVALAGIGPSTLVRFAELEAAVIQGRRRRPQKNAQPQSIEQLSADLNAALGPLHRRILDAGQRHPASKRGVPLQRHALAGITTDIADKARGLNDQRIKGVGTLDAPTRDYLLKVLRRIAGENRAAMQAAMLWGHVRDFLADEGASDAARIDVVELDDGSRAFRLKGLDKMGKGWRALPTLNLDATANMQLIRQRFPQAELVADVVAAEPYVTVNQVVGRSFSNSALGISRSKNAAGQWEQKLTPTVLAEDVRQDILAKATMAGGKWLVIAPKTLALHWRKTFPPSVAVEWFGNVRGINKYRDVAGVSVVGRWGVGPNDVGRLAGILSGRAVARVDGWYPTATVTLAAADGSTRTVDADRHPDPLADAIRQALVVDELLQAIGRGRGSQRGPADPLDVTVYGNTPLPLPLATLSDWSAPGPDAAMLVDHGAWLGSAGDAAEATGLTLKAMRRQREHGRARMAPCPYKEIFLYGHGANLPAGLAVAAYQRKGAGRSENRMIYAPDRIADPEAWLVARFGPLAHFEADERLHVDPDHGGLDVPHAQPMAISVARSTGQVRAEDVDVEDDLPNADLSAYAGGIMPLPVQAAYRAACRAAGLTQQQVADLAGISRPQLTNGLRGRYGLSAEAAARLRAVVATLPTVQPALPL